MSPHPPRTTAPGLLPVAPASFFAMTLGLAETGNAWRNATDLWHLSPVVGEALQGLALLSFLWWGLLYANKWISHRPAALAEFRDPVQSAFVALIPESIILTALALRPYAPAFAIAVFTLGSVTNLAYGAYRLAQNWSQEREAGHTTPSLYLTYVASVLVNALAAGLFGFTSLGWVLLGIGGLSWLVTDSVITQQLFVGGLAAKTRNFMGIYMAPPVVALVAYQVLAGPEASLPLTYILLGYALFITAGLALAYRWLREQAFAPGYWAYTFGVATLAQGLMIFAPRAASPVVDGLAAVALVATSLLTLAVALGSVGLLVRRAYYPATPAPAPAR
ncbi:hypothetical protein UAJ10_27020 [Nitrospirillum sp. BR 11164]|uniref:SLAC1 family transporter n=1 Tax=Nitrospirillum sp. BR 11164 TaxID=3104324 RepID=UPI002AFDF0DB|nr:hypothetical protein [Nitrospirillum sp. BR 11164]MEA1652651.1 hypothetical protein [Nitrospirillum sp. BR 11164]